MGAGGCRGKTLFFYSASTRLHSLYSLVVVNQLCITLVAVRFRQATGAHGRPSNRRSVSVHVGASRSP